MRIFQDGGTDSSSPSVLVETSINNFIEKIEKRPTLYKNRPSVSQTRAKDSAQFSIYFEHLPVAIINIEQNITFVAWEPYF